MTDDFAPFEGPTTVEFQQAAQTALDRMPTEFREKMRGVVLTVQEFASPEQLASVEIANRWELTGLYEGTPLTEQSVWDASSMPPIISLFRQPLLREMAEDGVPFEELVRHVVIHEAGHHFGFSDEDMHALEDMVSD